MRRRNFLPTLAFAFFPFYIPPWEIDTVPAYIPNPDDATAPLEPVLAGTAAADFRALKKKINNVFLQSEYFPGLLQQGVKSGLLITLNPPAQTDTRIMYGLFTNITRNDMPSAGGVTTVGIQVVSVQGNNLNNVNVSIFGQAIEAWTSPTNSQATLVGLETSVISQYNNNAAPLVGLDVVFKNRPDTFLAPVQGLGANHYNVASRGIQVTSQAPGTSGEYCGWHRGLTFEINSISQALVAGVIVPGTVIDMTSMGEPLIPLAYNNPWIAYKHSSALALSEFMSITWDKLRQTRMFLDSFNRIMWLFAIGGSSTPVVDAVKCVGFDYLNNYLTLPIGVIAGAPGAPTGTFQIKVAGVVRNVHFS